MKVVSMVLALAVSLVMVGQLSAGDDQKAREGRRPRHPMAGPWMMLKGLNLTADQKAKVEEIKKAYAPKFKEGRKKFESILTEEQQKARAEARKAAEAAGKKGREVWQEVRAVVKLTDQQKAQLDEARKAGQAMRQEIREKIMALLTPEQKEQLRKERKERQEHRRGYGTDRK